MARRARSNMESRRIENEWPKTNLSTLRPLGMHEPLYLLNTFFVPSVVSNRGEGSEIYRLSNME